MFTIQGHSGTVKVHLGSHRAALRRRRGLLQGCQALRASSAYIKWSYPDHVCCRVISRGDVLSLETGQMLRPTTGPS